MKFKCIFTKSTTFLFLIVSIGCNVLDTNDSRQIEGKWFEDASIESVQNLTQRLEYTFNSDNTFEAMRILIESPTNKIIGYRFARIGVYVVNGNQLTMATGQIFTINQQPEPLYVPRNELKAFEVDEQPLEIIFDIQNNKMTWKYPPCPPNANCIGTKEFFRKNK